MPCPVCGGHSSTQLPDGTLQCTSQRIVAGVPPGMGGNFTGVVAPIYDVCSARFTKAASDQVLQRQRARAQAAADEFAAALADSPPVPAPPTVDELQSIEDPIQRFVQSMGRCCAIETEEIPQGDPGGGSIRHQPEFIHWDVLDSVLPGCCRRRPDVLETHPVDLTDEDVAFWFASEATAKAIDTQFIPLKEPDVPGSLFRRARHGEVRMVPAWRLEGGDAGRLNAGRSCEDALIGLDGDLWFNARPRSPYQENGLSAVGVIRMAHLLELAEPLEPR